MLVSVVCGSVLVTDEVRMLVTYEVRVTDEVRVLVFGVSRGETTRLVEMRAAAITMAAATYA